MKEIRFNNKNGIQIILFKNFKYSSNKVINTISFDCDINFDFFNIKTTFFAELSDLRELALSLNQMHNEQLKSILFSPYSGNIIMKFKLNNGNIKVLCNITNDLSTGNFEFEYYIDQSFLPSLIADFKNILI